VILTPPILIQPALLGEVTTQVSRLKVEETGVNHKRGQSLVCSALGDIQVSERAERRLALVSPERHLVM
jgi:hypothetical protein